VDFLSRLDRALSSARADFALIDLPGSPAAIADIIVVDAIIRVLRWPNSLESSIMPTDWQ
jgi:hypothetical protein